MISFLLSGFFIYQFLNRFRSPETGEKFSSVFVTAQISSEQ